MSRCPLLAQSGHGLVHRTCPLLGVKQTSLFALHMSAYDPKRPCSTTTAPFVGAAEGTSSLKGNLMRCGGYIAGSDY